MNFSVFLILSILLHFSQSKTFTKQVPISQLVKKQYIYLTKFGIDIGQGYVEFRGRFLNVKGNASSQFETINFAIILDDDWPLVEQEKDCDNKLQLSKIQSSMNVPTDGEWSLLDKKSLTQQRRDRIWYFALVSCNQNLQALIAKGMKFEIEMNIINNESHFSSEEKGLQKMYLFHAIISIILVVYGFRKLNIMKRQDGNYDTIFVIILVSLIFDLSSEILKFIHYQVYFYDGEGILIFDVFGQISNFLSQYTIAVTLILVAFGWTLTQYSIQDSDIYLPIIFAMLIVKIMVIVIGRITDNDSGKYHQYQGVVGIIMILIGIGYLILFLFGIHLSLRDAKSKLKKFLQVYRLIGCLYFIAFPTLIIISDIFVATYYRNRVITIGTILVQKLSLMVLVHCITSKHSVYNEINFKNQLII